MHSPIKNGRISSPYGSRSGGFHAGMDLASIGSGVGTPVYAAHSGVVEKTVATRGPGDTSSSNQLATGRTGNGVIIRSADGKRQLYGHVAPAVAVGQNIPAGARIGSIDLSGNTTGPHVHFETWANASAGSHYNPQADFDASGIKPGSDTGQGATPAPTPTPSITNQEDYPMIYRAAGTNFGIYAHNGGWVILASQEEYDNLKAAGVPHAWITKFTLDNLMQDSRSH